MANREACELLIEPEIKEGLESGKKPNSIGKYLSAWVEKVFDTYIQPNTIIKRAERQQKKNWSNDHKKTEQNSEIEVKNDNRKRSLPDLPRLAGTITSSELSEAQRAAGRWGVKK